MPGKVESLGDGKSHGAARDGPVCGEKKESAEDQPVNITRMIMGSVILAGLLFFKRRIPRSVHELLVELRRVLSRARVLASRGDTSLLELPRGMREILFSDSLR